MATVQRFGKIPQRAVIWPHVLTAVGRGPRPREAGGRTVRPCRPRARAGRVRRPLDAAARGPVPRGADESHVPHMRTKQRDQRHIRIWGRTRTSGQPGQTPCRAHRGVPRIPRIPGLRDGGLPRLFLEQPGGVVRPRNSRSPGPFSVGRPPTSRENRPPALPADVDQLPEPSDEDA